MYYRLPIIQGGTFSFFVPTFAILSLPGFVCPEDFDMKNRKWTRSNMTYDEKTEEWQIRMREIQGAICVSAIFQVVMGFSGRRFSIRIDEIQLIIILFIVQPYCSINYSNLRTDGTYTQIHYTSYDYSCRCHDRHCTIWGCLGPSLKSLGYRNGVNA